MEFIIKLIVILPFVSFFISLLFSKYFNRIFTIHLAMFVLVFDILLLITLVIVYVLSLSSSFSAKIGWWMLFDYIEIDWGFYVDFVTIIMLIVVIVISCVVHIFSISYMKNDPHVERFISFISLFTGFMLILITADNFVLLFVGWEGVGFCSYLLINFWFTRIAANKASLKAILVNRIGDSALIIATVTSIKYFGTLNFYVLFTLMPFFINEKIIFLNHFNISVISWIAFWLLIAAVGKSAQLGLHTWLPDAMEGPTPVSALIHAATMVTAGVYLVIRFNCFFENSNSVLLCLLIISSLTLVFGSLVACFQSDVKKVIAFSTCSQLGYMFLACGLSSYLVGLSHLFNHAFFKALLFLTAGQIIHSLSDEQDVRRYGGLLQKMILNYMFFFIGSLSLTGFFFTSGFFSKDFIIELNYSEGVIIKNSFFYFMSMLGVLGTTFYSIKTLYVVFFKKTNIYKSYLIGYHRASILSNAPLIFLSVFSFISGWLFDNFFDINNFFNYSSFIVYNKNFTCIEAEFIPIYVKLLPFFTLIFFMFIIYAYLKFTVVHSALHFNPLRIKLLTLFKNKVNFDILQNIFLHKMYKVSLELYVNVDKGVVESFNAAYKKVIISLESFLNINKKLDIYLYVVYLTISCLVVIDIAARII